MKFQPDTPDEGNAITRHEAGCVWVGAVAYRRSVLVPRVGEVLDWEPTAHATLQAAHFERIARLPQRPEVVIFGSGTRLRFVPAALLQALIDAGIGVETMDTPAACRTYNVLAAERRAVLAALLIGPDTI